MSIKSVINSQVSYWLGWGVALALFTGKTASFENTALDIVSKKSASIENVEELSDSFQSYVYENSSAFSVFNSDEQQMEFAQRTHDVVELAEEGKVFELDASVDNFKVNGDTLYLKDFSKETVNAVMTYLASPNP